MALLTQPHIQRLEALRTLRHVLQGESGSIVLKKIDQTTGGFADLVTVSKSWTKDRISQGLGIFIEEFQIGEGQITSTVGDQVAAVSHGTRIYKISNRIPPNGFDRYWRFQIQPVEAV